MYRYDEAEAGRGVDVTDDAPVMDIEIRDSKGRARPTPPMETAIADTHAHLGMLTAPAIALARAAVRAVDFIVCMTDPSEPTGSYIHVDAWCAQCRAILDRWESEGVIPGHVEVPRLRFATGVHPHNAKCYTADKERELIDLAADPRTAAIGEIGLDYHYDLSPRDLQREVFARQIDLAHRMGLPIVLHIREAHDEALGILRTEGIPEAGCVLHCFNLGSDVLRPFLDLGCHIAFGGPITFSKSDEVRSAAPLVPLTRLLTETDCPYMAPVPCRGIECEPACVTFSADMLCRVWCADHPEMERGGFLAATLANARDVFDRVPSGWQRDEGAIDALRQAAAGCVSDEESAALIASSKDVD